MSTRLAFLRAVNVGKRRVDMARLKKAVQDAGYADAWTYIKALAVEPTPAQNKALEALSGDFDTLLVEGPDVHWRMRGKSSDSPLTRRDWEKVLGPLSSTSRNTTMLAKLLAKAGG